MNKEKIKKILKILSTIVALLWIFGETTSLYTDLTKIAGVLIMWGIVIYSLGEGKKISDIENLK